MLTCGVSYFLVLRTSSPLAGFGESFDVLWPDLDVPFFLVVLGGLPFLAGGLGDFFALRLGDSSGGCGNKSAILFSELLSEEEKLFDMVRPGLPELPLLEPRLTLDGAD